MKRAPLDIAKRVLLWLLAGITMLSGYGLTKLHPYDLPDYLPLTRIDQAVPFLYWTIWPYGTASYAALFAFLQAPDRLSARRLYFAVALAACICWVFFALYPTTYPRAMFPLPPYPTGDSWLDWMKTQTIAEFADLRDSDTPSNCFPSQHVALAWSLGLTWQAFLKRWWTRALPIVWAVIVTFATLTTKQHYVWDLPSGLLVGAFAAAVVHWGIHADTEPWWGRFRPLINVTRDADIRAIAALRARVEDHQWKLSDVPWPTGPLPKLDPRMERLLNEVIYVEEIAGLNFRQLEAAAQSDDLRRLYGLFADEERRHADGLRKVLALHGGALKTPGLGNALVLDQFDRIDARLDSDALLVAVANPVFETFLDAGTIPFLQSHEALRGPAFDAFVERVTRDEAAHLAVNWIITREVARNHQGWKGLRFALNPNIVRGMGAVPSMSMDVYAHAAALGFKFETLFPPFQKLFLLHGRYPELAGFVPWQFFRVFCLYGSFAAWTCITLDRFGLLDLRFWCGLSRVQKWFAKQLFGPQLLARRGLPAVGPRWVAPEPLDSELAPAAK
jgi:membrane-associated phospholipid phosphatase